MIRCEKCGGEQETKQGDSEWVHRSKQGTWEDKEHWKKSRDVAIRTLQPRLLSIRLTGVRQEGAFWFC